jgi:hypothetical protein
MQLNAIEHACPHALLCRRLRWHGQGPHFVRAQRRLRSVRKSVYWCAALSILRHCMFLPCCPFNNSPKARWSMTKKFSENLSTFKKKTTILKSKWHSNYRALKALFLKSSQPGARTPSFNESDKKSNSNMRAPKSSIDLLCSSCAAARLREQGALEGGLQRFRQRHLQHSGQNNH